MSANPAPDSLGHVLISSMRDEGPFVLEFVAHHRVVGFDHIFIASNDCRDGTDLVLDALTAAGVIGHVRSTLKPGDVPQHAAYRMMRRRFGLDRADWLMVLDADEFLQVSVGQGRVQDLTAAAPPGTDIIALNPMTFGTSDGDDWQPGLVTRQFRHRAAARSVHNRPVKSLTTRLSRFREINNHSVVMYRGTEPLRVMRGDGKITEIVPDAKLWMHLRRTDLDPHSHDLAHYNHYAIKSLASFLLRHDRGRGAAPNDSGPNTRHTEGYWAGLASASIRDDSIITRYGAALDDEMARLLTLPGVAAAQAETERRYRALLDAL